MIIPGVLVEENGNVNLPRNSTSRSSSNWVNPPSTRSSNSSSPLAGPTITAHPHLVVFLLIEVEDLHQVPPDLVEL